MVLCLAVLVSRILLRDAQLRGFSKATSISSEEFNCMGLQYPLLDTTLEMSQRGSIVAEDQTHETIQLIFLIAQVAVR